jgi:hypothetical protein
MFASTSASLVSDLPRPQRWRSRYREVANGLIGKTVQPPAINDATSRPLAVSIATGTSPAEPDPSSASVSRSWPKPSASLPIRSCAIRRRCRRRPQHRGDRRTSRSRRTCPHSLLQSMGTGHAGALMESALGTTPHEPSRPRLKAAPELAEGSRPDSRQGCDLPAGQSITTRAGPRPTPLFSISGSRTVVFQERRHRPGPRARAMPLSLLQRPAPALDPRHARPAHLRRRHRSGARGMISITTHRLSGEPGELQSGPTVVRPCWLRVQGRTSCSSRRHRGRAAVPARRPGRKSSSMANPRAACGGSTSLTPLTTGVELPDRRASQPNVTPLALRSLPSTWRRDRTCGRDPDRTSRPR